MELDTSVPTTADNGDYIPMGIDISTERVDQRTVRVCVAGELDLSTSKALERELEEVLTEGSRTSVVLDLSRLSFLDSTGLRALWTARQHALSAGGTLVLDEASDPVRRVLNMTKLDKVFMRADEDAATSADGGRSGNGHRT